jgi:hypothetical protein
MGNPRLVVPLRVLVAKPKVARVEEQTKKNIYEAVLPYHDRSDARSQRLADIQRVEYSST